MHERQLHIFPIVLCLRKEDKRKEGYRVISIECVNMWSLLNVWICIYLWLYSTDRLITILNILLTLRHFEKHQQNKPEINLGFWLTHIFEIYQNTMKILNFDTKFSFCSHFFSFGSKAVFYNYMEKYLSNFITK